MATTREQAVNALLNALTQSGQFRSVGRRNRAPESFQAAETPALMLVDVGETYVRAPGHAKNLPPKRILLLAALVYVDTGNDQNAIPSAVMNPLLDSIDTALAPSPVLGLNNLGGLVDYCMIEGNIRKAPGEITGRSLALVPIKIQLP